MSELLPCPFCGGSSARVYERTCNQDTPYDPTDIAYPRVRCKCGCEVPGKNWSLSATAIAAWNTRSYASSQAEIERLREVLSKFMDYADAEYVPNTLFDRARAALSGSKE